MRDFTLTIVDFEPMTFLNLEELKTSLVTGTLNNVFKCNYFSRIYQFSKNGDPNLMMLHSVHFSKFEFFFDLLIRLFDII